MQTIIQIPTKTYEKTINLLYAGNKVFVKYQAQGGVNPKPPPLAYALDADHLESLSSPNSCNWAWSICG